MKLDLRKPILNLDGSFLSVVVEGKVIQDKQLMSNILAAQLVQSVSGNPIKFFDWAVKLTNEGIIDVDQADIKVLRDFVEGHPQLFIIAKAQLIKEFDKVKV